MFRKSMSAFQGRGVRLRCGRCIGRRWGQCRPSRCPGAYGSVRGFAAQAGFSLLEVLIALSILGLAVAIVIPPMSAVYERRQMREAFSSVNAWLTSQRLSARLSGAGRSHAAGPIFNPELELPDGWSVEFLSEWRIHPSGVCGASAVRVSSPRGRIWERVVGPPDCRMGFRIQVHHPIN